MKHLKARLATQAIVVLGLIGTSGSALAQSWVNQSDMKLPRVEATTIDYRDNIYVFNGFIPGIKIANSVEKYDVATKQWDIISRTSTDDGSAMTHNGIVRVGADVWLIGGRIGSHPGRVSDLIWIYNLDNNKWRPGPKLPTPVAAGGAALVNNTIHWFGGIDANASCDVGTHLTYDLSKPASGWKNITSTAAMPVPRNHFSTAVVNGIIYAMGGQFGHDNCPGKNTDDTTLVHAYNPKTNKWSQKAGMPNKNSHSEPGTFVYKGDIYTTGGENALDKVWKYSPNANKWTTFRELPEKLVAPIARIVDGRLIVAGGGAPLARNAVKTVRSLHVDNNPPAVQREPTPAPVPTPAPTPAPTPEPGSHTPEGSTLISMEAEYFDVDTKTSTHQWVHVARGNSSNDDAMITTPDQGELSGSTANTPMLSYLVNFNHSGKHFIWIRGLGDSNASGVGNSDSIQVGLNGTVSSTAFRIDQFPNQWTWSRHTPSNPVASLNVVNAGVNMVNFWMREDGLAIDKFVITSDPDFVPTGFGPDVTDGTQDFQPPVSTVVDVENVNIATDDSVASEIETQAEETTDINTEANLGPDTLDDDVSENVSDENGVFVITDTDQPGSDTISDDLLVAEPTNDEQLSLDPTSEEAVAGVVATTNTSSGDDDGLFGGSASVAALFALLSVCLVRVGRAKRIRLA